MAHCRRTEACRVNAAPLTSKCTCACPACRVSAVPASEKSRPLTRARWGEVATCTSPMPGT
eukprot:scaffold55167_cov66-Phaeocystis_antarctica.AAC.2